MEQINFVDLKKQFKELENEIVNSVSGVLESGQYILGPLVEEIEDKLSLYANVNNVVTVSSGTDALFVSLHALGIGPGSKVYIPSFTYTATAEVIVLVGAEPVFVDVTSRSFNISCKDLEEKIEKYRPTKDMPSAIIAVDLFGLPAKYDRLNDIANRYNLSLISDAAQSFGASIGNKKVGKLAPITTTSFYPTKPLSCCGDGGAIFTDDDDLAQILRSVRTHGISDNPYENIRIGTNARFDAIQAAILLKKLTIFDQELEKRKNVAAIYNQELDQIVETPMAIDGVYSAWAHYTIKTKKRDKLKMYLSDANIPSMIYYPKPMHDQIAYKKYSNGDNLKISTDLCQEVLSLPMHPYLSEEQVIYITEKIKKFLD